MIRRVIFKNEADRQRACVGKLAYHNKAHAKRTLRAMHRHNRIEPRNGFRLSVYHCIYCNFWHLGNKPINPVPTVIR